MVLRQLQWSWVGLEIQFTDLLKRGKDIYFKACYEDYNEIRLYYVPSLNWNNM